MWKKSAFFGSQGEKTLSTVLEPQAMSRDRPSAVSIYRLLMLQTFHSNLGMQYVREERRCNSNATGRRGRGYRQEHTSAGGGAIDAPPRSRQSAAVYMRSVEERKGMVDVVTADNEAANALPGKSETRRAGSAARPVQMRRTDTLAAPRNGKAEEEMVEDRRVARVQLREGAFPPQA